MKKNMQLPWVLIAMLVLLLLPGSPRAQARPMVVNGVLTSPVQQSGQQLPQSGQQLPQSGQQLPQSGQQLPQSVEVPLLGQYVYQLGAEAFQPYDFDTPLTQMKLL